MAPVTRSQINSLACALNTPRTTQNSSTMSTPSRQTTFDSPLNESNKNSACTTSSSSSSSTCGYASCSCHEASASSSSSSQISQEQIRTRSPIKKSRNVSSSNYSRNNTEDKTTMAESDQSSKNTEILAKNIEDKPICHNKKYFDQDSGACASSSRRSRDRIRSPIVKSGCVPKKIRERRTGCDEQLSGPSTSVTKSNFSFVKSLSNLPECSTITTRNYIPEKIRERRKGCEEKITEISTESSKSSLDARSRFPIDTPQTNSTDDSFSFQNKKYSPRKIGQRRKGRDEKNTEISTVSRKSPLDLRNRSPIVTSQTNSTDSLSIKNKKYFPAKIRERRNGCDEKYTEICTASSKSSLDRRSRSPIVTSRTNSTDDCLSFKNIKHFPGKIRKRRQGCDENSTEVCTTSSKSYLNRRSRSSIVTSPTYSSSDSFVFTKKKYVPRKIRERRMCCEEKNENHSAPSSRKSQEEICNPSSVIIISSDDHISVESDESVINSRRSSPKSFGIRELLCDSEDSEQSTPRYQKRSRSPIIKSRSNSYNDFSFKNENNEKIKSTKSRFSLIMKQGIPKKIDKTRRGCDDPNFEQTASTFKKLQDSRSRSPIIRVPNNTSNSSSNENVRKPVKSFQVLETKKSYPENIDQDSESAALSFRIPEDKIRRRSPIGTHSSSPVARSSNINERRFSAVTYASTQNIFPKGSGCSSLSNSNIRDDRSSVICYASSQKKSESAQNNTQQNIPSYSMNFQDIFKPGPSSAPMYTSSQNDNPSSSSKLIYPEIYQSESSSSSVYTNSPDVLELSPSCARTYIKYQSKISCGKSSTNNLQIPTCTKSVEIVNPGPSISPLFKDPQENIKPGPSFSRNSTSSQENIKYGRSPAMSNKKSVFFVSDEPSSKMSSSSTQPDSVRTYSSDNHNNIYDYVSDSDSGVLTIVSKSNSIDTKTSSNQSSSIAWDNRSKNGRSSPLNKSSADDSSSNKSTSSDSFDEDELMPRRILPSPSLTSTTNLFTLRGSPVPDVRTLLSRRYMVFACPEQKCNLVSTQARAIINHHKRKHPNRLYLYHCLSCREKFASQEVLDIHRIGEHFEEMRCVLCNSMYSGHPFIEEHAKMHQKEQIKCNTCSAPFVGRSYLSAHKKAVNRKVDSFNPQLHGPNICTEKKIYILEKLERRDTKIDLNLPGDVRFESCEPVMDTDYLKDFCKSDKCSHDNSPWRVDLESLQDD